MTAEEIIEQVEKDAAEIAVRCHISPITGYLAERPLTQLPSDPDPDRDNWLQQVDHLASSLPILTKGAAVVTVVNKIPMPRWTFYDLSREAQYLLLLNISMLTHAWFRESLGYQTVRELHADKSTKYLCPQLAIPLFALANNFGMDPTMAYELYGLWNGLILDANHPLTVENFRPIRTFTGLETEHWFLQIHFAIEANNARGILARHKAYLLSTHWEGERWDPALMRYMKACLRTAAQASWGSVEILKRMREHLDPATYFKMVRMSYAFPQNVVFLDVEELKEEEQNFDGETGGGSESEQDEDVVMGTPHRETSRQYFDARRRQMPTERRELLYEIQAASRVRDLVIAHRDDEELVRDFNSNPLAKTAFRKDHRGLAAESIDDFGDTRGTANPVLTTLDNMTEDTDAGLIHY